MNKANQNYQKKESTPFMKIKDASRVTGLSMVLLPQRLQGRYGALQQERHGVPHQCAQAHGKAGRCGK